MRFVATDVFDYHRPSKCGGARRVYLRAQDAAEAPPSPLRRDAPQARQAARSAGSRRPGRHDGRRRPLSSRRSAGARTRNVPPPFRGSRGDLPGTSAGPCGRRGRARRRGVRERRRAGLPDPDRCRPPDPRLEARSEDRRSGGRGGAGVPRLPRTESAHPLPIFSTPGSGRPRVGASSPVTTRRY